MSLEDLLAVLNDVKYAPRTLTLHRPEGLAGKLSPSARGFIEVAFGDAPRTKSGDRRGLKLSPLDLTDWAWRDDPVARDLFSRFAEDTQLEILAFITLFVHEYTHRIDFLISPFGLQYYVNTMREYWHAQQFFPRVLDDPQTVGYVRNLASFRDNFSGGRFPDEALQSAWTSLEDIIHTFYAWGDGANVLPLAKHVRPGWGSRVTGAHDLFGVGVELETVTVLDRFATARPLGGERWYLRPMTLFETKALVNTLLFIMKGFGPEGPATALLYYERLYLSRKDELTPDYFFLLDIGARIFRLPDFHALLETGSPEMIRAVLVILSSACWFALQAPPPLKGEDPALSNPSLRLWRSLRFMSDVSRRRIEVPEGDSTAQLFLRLEQLDTTHLIKPISEVIPDCVRVIDNMIALNEDRTWNPDMRAHFKKVLKVMRPHFATRDGSYVSWMGCPDDGNPLAACRTPEDWEVTYDDNEAPEAVKEWFDRRGDLFFGLLRPTEEVMQWLEAHYRAFFFPHRCACGQGVTGQWQSRFSDVFKLDCGFCGKVTHLRREDMTVL